MILDREFLCLIEENVSVTEEKGKDDQARDQEEIMLLIHPFFP